MEANLRKIVKNDGRLMIEVVDTIRQVKDPCKSLTISRYAN